MENRMRADVLILERYGCFGGVISQVGVEGFAWYRHEGTVEAGGLVPEFEEASIEVGGRNPECQSTSQALAPPGSRSWGSIRTWGSSNTTSLLTSLGPSSAMPRRRSRLTPCSSRARFARRIFPPCSPA